MNQIARRVTGLCATGVLLSAPLVTLQVVPDTLVTRTISPVFPDAVSATWNWVTPVLAAGKLDDDATVHVSVVPDDGAVVPPDETVVWGWLAKDSAVTHALPG